MRRSFFALGELTGRGRSFRGAVLSHAAQSGGLLTNYPYRSTVQQDIGHAELLRSLPVGEGIIYRGTAGISEIVEIMRSGEMGTGKYARRTETLQIPEFIEVNDSRFLLSASPCPQTVQDYAEGLSVIPTKGYIIVMGMPKVFIRPQLVLHLDRELYEEYAQAKIAREEEGMRGAYKPIVATAQGNNEVTIILGTSKRDNWRPEIGTDVMKIVEITAPGKFLGKYMAAKRVHSRTIDNEEYVQRPWAIEVATTRHSVLPDFKPAYERMNRRADELGLMTLSASERRLLTIDDAEAIMRSGVLEEFAQRYTSGKTLVFREVPKEIPIGHADALNEFMISELKSDPTLREMMRAENPAHF
ncbi:hypothetical protein OQJ19_12885 [Fluoribacter gormanii]|uniref:Uncharacterized protein n=1 Tax=Fluoribacter gormanii TaxID=464 RepID=A0A377GLA8_9GAMM|nr:hypothetical protein [Fluoribacter gormanii]KTD05343.1 hypothetical protein Lgor_0333 [Fluoribacter gormanii]MCW8443045.1 hypothetical protein [Fluoribacter gormanii]MCW8471535.1 hypothetical protein [Fluoribacter gormanii]SIR63269.1 hypothetical protein SAMN05421777_11788 [Fluoribacter gormanii]STO25353.1 Uncharacterised protein [Fluoribacter gormanii]